MGIFAALFVFLIIIITITYWCKLGKDDDRIIVISIFSLFAFMILLKLCNLI